MKFDKTIYLLFAVLLVFAIVPEPASATFSFNNYVDFKPNEGSKYGTIDVWDGNIIWPDEKVASYTLLDNTDLCLIHCQAEGTSTILKEGRLFDDVTFEKLDKSLAQIKDYQFYTSNKDEEYNIEVPIYKEVCEKINKTEVCSEKIVEYKTEIATRPLWEEYKGEILKAGEYKWKLEGEKEASESIDWIVTSNEVKLSQWTTWNSSFSNGLGLYYNFNDTTNAVDGTYNLTNRTGFPSAAVNVVFNNSNCLIGKCGQFTAASKSHLRIPNETTFTNLGSSTLPRTVNFWVRQQVKASSELMTRCASSICATYDGYVNVHGIDFYLSTDNIKWLPNFPDLTYYINSTPSHWTMITYVKNSTSGGKWYVNGTSVTPYLTDGMIDANLPIIIGAYGDGVQDNFQGQYDEMGWWNRTLSAGEITDLYNGGAGMTYEPDLYPLSISTTLISPANATNYSVTSATFSANATAVKGNVTNMTLYIWNATGGQTTNSTTGLTGTFNSTSLSKSGLTDGNYTWNYYSCAVNSTGSLCAWGTNNLTFTIDTAPPVISILTPSGNQGIKIIPYNVTLNYTATDSHLSSCWYNSSFNSSLTPTTCNTLVNISVPNSGTNTIYVYANDTLGNTNSNSSSFYVTIGDNGITYTSPVISGESNTIIGNFTSLYPITSAILSYNNVNYTPSISIINNNSILTSIVIAPNVNVSTNITFYYILTSNSIEYLSSSRNQTVNNLAISTDCSSNFTLINISNYDEETLLSMNGTVEYFIQSINNNLVINEANGTVTGENITLCSNINLSSSTAELNIQIRYYAPEYIYKTYNIQNGDLSAIPYNINLYYLNSSIGTQFIINYVDFNYLTRPGALIQIQRQYLSDNTYKIVEIPSIASNGAAVGSFDTNNIRYKLIVIQNGQIIDTFNDIFPICQNAILGTCTIELRGAQTNPSQTTGDFSYTLTTSGNNVILTYIIPSGTPKTVTMSTEQNTRFIGNITTCNTTIFASGGTITCGYNNTIGDSLVNAQIDVSGQPSLYVTIGVPEDLQGFFLLNNYVIAFFLLLTLVLIFMTSAMAMLVISGVGIVFLGLIFLINGVSILNVGIALTWLGIAIFLVIYKISQKEERT